MRKGLSEELGRKRRVCWLDRITHADHVTATASLGKEGTHCRGQIIRSATECRVARVVKSRESREGLHRYRKIVECEKVT